MKDDLVEARDAGDGVWDTASSFQLAIDRIPWIEGRGMSQVLSGAGERR